MGDRFELGHIHPTNQSGQSSVVSVVGKCVNRVVMFLVVIRRRRDLLRNVFYESRAPSRLFHSSQIGPRRRRLHLPAELSSATGVHPSAVLWGCVLA